MLLHHPNGVGTVATGHFGDPGAKQLGVTLGGSDHSGNDTQQCRLAGTAGTDDRNFFAHIDPDGNTPPDRALAAGFCHEYVGENLATGFRDADAVMAGWIASEGHNANLLNADYALVGIGVARTPADGAVWVQEFAYDPGVVTLSTSASLAR